ncbi:fatty acyl-AMP ligase [Actinomadura scrupuli]|uniref:fatty acyl-AMP ligase n=1 Tax=Actinomadura scrupuli TaxID=559629 RepID=UPI003D99BDC3
MRYDNSLPEILQRRSEGQGEALAFRFLADGTGDQAIDWTYRSLAGHAATVAASLEGTAGRRVVLAVDPGLHYVAALFGALVAGATVVPSFPPAGRRATARFLAILADCSPAVIIGSGWLAAEMENLAGQLPPDVRRARWLFIDDGFFQRPGGPPDLPVQALNPALLQYTSGSTGDPKGIILTHDNIMSNCLALQRHMGVVSGRVGCSWLPPYHDMGLMGTIMLALHGGWPLVMLSPIHFVQQPYRWLKAITDYGVTISVAPNFALDMCVDTITDEEMQALDLSTLRQLYCGAEPVLKTTLDRFRDRFASRGYRESSLIPCYGMAEATLFVSGKPDGTLRRSVWLDKPALEQGSARAAAPGTAQATELVSCGAVAHDHEVIIVDPRTLRPVGPGAVGEIWVSGPSVAEGCFGRPRSAGTFSARPHGADHGRTYLRTGDLGFLLDAELFVTGRLKDVVIIAGRNLFPQDIEVSALTAHADLRRAAAFSVRPDGGEEQLVIVAEFRRAGSRTEADLAEAREAVVAAVTAEHGVGPAAVHLGPPGTIPTTTSGKVRRGAARQAYGQGSLKKLTVAAAADPLATSGGRT